MKPKVSSLKKKKKTDIIDKPLTRITKSKTEKTQDTNTRIQTLKQKLKNIMNNFLPIN